MSLLLCLVSFVSLQASKRTHRQTCTKSNTHTHKKHTANNTSSINTHSPTEHNNSEDQKKNCNEMSITTTKPATKTQSKSHNTQHTNTHSHDTTERNTTEASSQHHVEHRQFHQFHGSSCDDSNHTDSKQTMHRAASSMQKTTARPPSGGHQLHLAQTRLPIRLPSPPSPLISHQSRSYTGTGSPSPYLSPTHVLHRNTCVGCRAVCS